MTKKADEVSYYDAAQGERTMECPECGWECDLWVDDTHWGYKCHNMTCLSFDELGPRP